MSVDALERPTAGSSTRRPPCVLVTDAGRGSAIAIIRSLGKRGMRIVAADADPKSPGFRSRYTAERLLYPPPTERPDEAASALLGAATALGVDLVIPVSDEVILPLSAARGQFSGVCELALAEPEALAAARNKLATLELADRTGVPRPRTVVVETLREARARAPEVGWPIVLKPEASRVLRGDRVDAFGVSYAASLDELEDRMEPLEGRCPVLLQEYYAGEGHGVELLLHEGRVLAAFQHRRIREVPFTGGASSLRQSVPIDPALFAMSERLLGELAWTGLAMVEFKVGPDGPRLMEVNGRVWGSLPLAVKSGMDFPAKLADLYLAGPPLAGKPADTRYRVGVRSRNLELDIVWIGSVLRGRRRYPFLPSPSRLAGLLAIADLFDPRDRFDILCLEDPKPGLAELGKIRRKLGRKLRETAGGVAPDRASGWGGGR
jgi:predicted ATP-grasp superfamily ATP-dependent carboligase